MQPLPTARPPSYTHHSLPPLGLHLTRWLPTFDLHQSPDLVELPPSPPPPSDYCYYHCRPTASTALVYAHPWALTVPCLGHPALAPLLPAIKYEPSLSSPSSACAPCKPKRKRGEQDQKSCERPGSSWRGNNSVATSTAAQVVKWKLNAPRYKRSKVETAGGGSEWKRCEHCGTDSTPEWRAGPLGKGTLCNACGLRYRTKLREQKKRETVCGSVPMSLLLNPVSASASASPGGNKKGRANISNPMIWETKVSTSSFHIADLLNHE